MKSFLSVCFLLNTLAICLVLLLGLNSMRSFISSWTSPLLVAHAVLAILVWRNLQLNTNHLAGENLMDDHQVTAGAKKGLKRGLIIAHLCGLAIQIVWLGIIVFESFVIAATSVHRDYSSSGTIFSPLSSAYFIAEVVITALGICAFIFLMKKLSRRVKEEPLDMDF